MSDDRPIIGVTMGDPAGIGPEITAEAVADEALRARIHPVVFADADHLERVTTRHGIDVDVRAVTDVEATAADGSVDVVDIDNVEGPLAYGEVRAEYGRASLAYVDRAVDAAMAGAVDGLCNAPIHKKAIARAGSDFAGHTEMMAARTDTDRHTVLVTDGRLHVTHHSLHVPLSTALDLVTADAVFETIRLTDDLLPEAGIENPTLGVLGVNPHAGDGGVIGDLEDAEVRPAVERVRAAGIDARGPLPPDSAFNRCLAGEFDCMVAMYHDQGHIPAFVDGYVEGGSVGATAVTLGLPFVRATTLHGTAYDIAGEGVAGADSMAVSLEMLADIVRRRRANR